MDLVSSASWQTSRAPTTVREVVETGNCSACGLCVSMFPEKLVMRHGKEKRFRPAQRAPNAKLTADEEAMVMAVCPGATIDAPKCGFKGGGRCCGRASSCDVDSDARGEERGKNANEDGGTMTSNKGKPAATLDHPVVGPTRRVVKGYAGDGFVRFQAAAAGGMTSVALWLLQNKDVDFVCHVHTRKYYFFGDA